MERSFDPNELFVPFEDALTKEHIPTMTFSLEKAISDYYLLLLITALTLINAIVDKHLPGLIN